MSRVPLSFSTMSSSPSKSRAQSILSKLFFGIISYIFNLIPNIIFYDNRYAEIVNVRLGDGSIRKGQVLEIAGKRAVVQVRTYLSLTFRSSKEHQALIICILMLSSLVMCFACQSVLRCSADHSMVPEILLTTVLQFSQRSSWTSR